MTAADRLAHLLQAIPPRLMNISDDEAARIPGPGRWSTKQILGHLIDSAGNNHQRFVRAQIAPRLEFPTYEQESWVAVQSYATESWPDLVNLWLLFNRHLLHIIQSVPEDCLSRPCAIGGKDPIPLSAVIDGYVDHLEHHLEQIGAS
ncbi:MAG: DinB family protein [Acidobacteriia bacterium]|nr:DinB family protein [Terriglobia bacterium]